MRVTVRHKFVEIVSKVLDDAYGMTDDDGKPGGRIYIDPTRHGKHDGLLLDTLIHELMHRAFPDVREEVIAEVSTDIAKAVTRFGFRYVHEEER